jgi:hypothetical protein
MYNIFILLTEKEYTAPLGKNKLGKYDEFYFSPNFQKTMLEVIYIERIGSEQK